MTAHSSDTDSPGSRLRATRIARGLSLRAVHAMSQFLAHKYRRKEFIISIRALSDLENGKLVPSVYKLQSLALVYNIRSSVLLDWYRG